MLQILYVKVAVSADHFIVVAMERLVYSWGNGSKGQLGHGDLESRDKPLIIEALKGKSVVRYNVFSFLYHF